MEKRRNDVPLKDLSDGPSSKNEISAGSGNEKKTYPWTPRRVAALVGIILLLAMYGSTMVFALSGSPDTRNLLMASIFCTIAVPILLYAMSVTAKNLRGRGADEEIHEAYRKIENERKKEDLHAAPESGKQKETESGKETEA